MQQGQGYRYHGGACTEDPATAGLEYRAPDGGVYFTVEAAKDDVQEAPTVKEAPEGPQEFKMDENVPKDENVQQQENVQEKKKKARPRPRRGQRIARRTTSLKEPGEFARSTPTVFQFSSIKQQYQDCPRLTRSF